MKKLINKKEQNEKKRKLKIIYKYIGDRSPETKKEAEKRVIEVYDFIFTKIIKKLV